MGKVVIFRVQPRKRRETRERREVKQIAPRVDRGAKELERELGRCAILGK